jgi:hypothetical protein
MTEPEFPDPTYTRQRVMQIVSDHFNATGSEVDSMAPSNTKNRLEDMLRHILEPAATNVQGAQGAAETLIAARVYAGLHSWFVAESRPATKHHERFQAHSLDLGTQLLRHIRIELLVDERLEQFVKNLAHRLDNSATVTNIGTLVTSVGSLVTRLSGYSDELAAAVSSIKENNETASCALSAANEELSAIHRTLRIFTEEMIGPMPKNGEENSTATGTGNGTAAAATGPATTSPGTGEGDLKTPNTGHETAPGAPAVASQGTREGGGY